MIGTLTFDQKIKLMELAHGNPEKYQKILETILDKKQGSPQANKQCTQMRLNMDPIIKSALFKAHHELFYLSVDLRDKDAKEKCKDMANFLREKLYDQTFEENIRLYPKNGSGSV